MCSGLDEGLVGDWLDGWVGVWVHSGCSDCPGHSDFINNETILKRLQLLVPLPSPPVHLHLSRNKFDVSWFVDKGPGQGQPVLLQVAEVCLFRTSDHAGGRSDLLPAVPPEATPSRRKHQCWWMQLQLLPEEDGPLRRYDCVCCTS